ncbi:nutritionally-regulated adipose and cardiac enriched protein homolog [Notechis scutatus]|uniref:Nutritionally-regulated adipose and cardiac enriched protein homolog n=1 Tax=Notechis scutatus TaxID=8663 RepID=A0A6J1U6B3_9SAUR|nr:nutritionally-regulated adipose and cardiac enriched protein homolog [Notechis scutatus]
MLLTHHGTEVLKELLFQGFQKFCKCHFLQHKCMPSISPMHKKEKPRFTQCPPSILRKKSSMKQALREKEKVERRVRFQEPGEIITNAHKQTVGILPLFLGLSFCVVMLLAASLYYNSRKQDFKVLEEFHSHLVTILILIRRIALKLWTWFLRQ